MAEDRPTVAGEGSRSPRASLLLRAAVLMAAACVIAGAAAVVWRVELAQWLIRRGAEAAGLEGVSVHVRRLDGQALTLTDLRVGDALAVDRIRATYGPSDLLGLRLASLDITGLRLAAQIVDGRLDLGALAPLLAAEEQDPHDPPSGGLNEGQDGGLLRSLRGLPVGEVRVAAAKIVLDGDYGPLEITGAGQLSSGQEDLALSAQLAARHVRGRIDAAVTAQSATDALVGRVDVTAASVPTELTPGLELDETSIIATATFRLDRAGLAVEIAEQPFRLTGRLAGEAFELVGSWPALTISQLSGEPDALTVSGKGGHLAPAGLAAFPFAVDRIDLDLQLGPTSSWPAGRVAIGLLPCDELAGWLPPLAFAARATPADDGGLAFDVDWELEGHPLRGSLRGELLAGTGPAAEIRAHVRLEPVTLGPAGLRIGELGAGWAAMLESVTGRVEIHGDALVRGDVTTLGATLSLADVSVRSGIGSVDGLSGTLRFDSLVPPLTPPGQVLTMQSVDLGVALGPGSVTFRLEEKDQLRIERAEWQFLGGSLRISGSYPWRQSPDEDDDAAAAPAETAAIKVELEHVDLAELLALVDLDGLEGSGRVSGMLPLRATSDGFEVRTGLLRAEGPGWIQYHDQALTSAAKRGSDRNLGILLATLENYQFTEATTVVQGPLGSELQFGIRLFGANPDYRDGATAKLNFNVSARLEDLFEKITAVATLPEKIAKAMLTGKEEPADSTSPGERCRTR